jgi:ADP-ribose pyrophosphatase YjhB (NUDIX family)
MFGLFYNNNFYIVLIFKQIMEKIKPRITSAVLVEKDGKFLLGERNKENYYQYWVIPGGGVKFGETIHEAAIREIKEETNLDIEIVKLIGHKEVINVPGKYHSIVFFHLAKPKHVDVEAKEDISKAKFFSIDEIKELKLAESAEWALKKIGVWK